MVASDIRNYINDNKGHADNKKYFNAAFTFKSQRRVATRAIITTISGLLIFLFHNSISALSHYKMGTTHISRVNGKGSKAMLCLMVKDEEAYIDEWVDYHHALGFDKIHVYDNSDFFEMKYWSEKQADYVETTHYPGRGKQREIYFDCAKKAVDDYTWVAFFDVDEFLFLENHKNVHNLLEEHLKSGALGINWLFYYPGPKDVIYSPLPVTKRFMYRDKKAITATKSIVKLSSLDLESKFWERDFYKPAICIHIFPLKEGQGSTHDTNGQNFTSFQNPNMPLTDVVTLRHYNKRSYKEYVTKRMKGQSDDEQKRKSNRLITQAQGEFAEALETNNRTEPGVELVFDDSVWVTMKKLVPKYAMFDNF